MSYQGGTNSKQFPELESVRRLREGGPGSGPHSGGTSSTGKETKFKDKKDAVLDKRLDKLAEYASSEGFTGSANRIEKIRKAAAEAGKYTDEHIEDLGTRVDIHTDMAKDADKDGDSDKMKFHDKFAASLEKAVEHHISEDENPENKYTPHY